MLSKYKNKFNPIISIFSKPFLFFSPNTITLFSLIPAIFSFYFVYNGIYLIGAVLAAFAFLLDSIDGYIARIKNLATKKGAYLDAIIDRINEIIIIAGFIKSFPIISFFLMSFSLLISYSKARGEMENRLGNLNYPQLMERGERAISIIFILFFSYFYPSYLKYLLILFLVLVFITFIQRFIFVFRQLD